MSNNDDNDKIAEAQGVVPGTVIELLKKPEGAGSYGRGEGRTLGANESTPLSEPEFKIAFAQESQKDFSASKPQSTKATEEEKPVAKEEVKPELPKERWYQKIVNFFKNDADNISDAPKVIVAEAKTEPKPEAKAELKAELPKEGWVQQVESSRKKNADNNSDAPNAIIAKPIEAKQVVNSEAKPNTNQEVKTEPKSEQPKQSFAEIHKGPKKAYNEDNNKAKGKSLYDAKPALATTQNTVPTLPVIQAPPKQSMAELVKSDIKTPAPPLPKSAPPKPVNSAKSNIKIPIPPSPPSEVPITPPPPKQSFVDLVKNSTPTPPKSLPRGPKR